MSDRRIWRPLTGRTKNELKEYAIGNRLEWVEDETNQQDVYLRNQLRKKSSSLPHGCKHRIYELWQSQLDVRRGIGREIGRRDFPVLDRYFMIMIDQGSARELLYRYCMSQFGVSLLNSQLERMWLAVKTGRPNTRWQIGQGVEISLLAREWRAEMVN